MVKGVGFNGKDDKEFAISPHNFAICCSCGLHFQEGEGPRFKEGSMLPYHQKCMEVVVDENL